MNKIKPTTSIVDTAVAKCGDLEVTVIGSLPETVADVLNKAYSDDTDNDIKRTIFSTESNDDEILAKRDAIDRSTDGFILASITPDSDIETIYQIAQKEAKGKDQKVHLLSIYNYCLGNKVFSNEEYSEKRFKLEEKVKSYGGRVFRMIIKE